VSVSSIRGHSFNLSVNLAPNLLLHPVVTGQKQTFPA
jgi:hypothetical protein